MQCLVYFSSFNPYASYKVGTIMISLNDETIAQRGGLSVFFKVPELTSRRADNQTEVYLLSSCSSPRQGMAKGSGATRLEFATPQKGDKHQNLSGPLGYD